MSEQNFKIKNGLTVNGTQVIDGNANGHFDTITANTFAVFGGGSVGGSDQFARDTANTGITLAQAAFDQANTGGGGISSIINNDTSVIINDVGTNSNIQITVDGTQTVRFTSNSILPNLDQTYNLGSPELQWKDVYIGPGSLYINGQKVIQETSGTIKFSADQDQNLRIETTGDGNIELDPTQTGSILLQGPVQIQSNSNISSSDGNPIGFGSPIATDSVTTKTLNTNLGLSANGTGIVSVNDDLTVTGNLTVQGSATNLSVNTLTVQDNIIDISSETTGSPTSNAGIRVVRGDEPAVQLRWNETLDKWQFTNDGTTYIDMGGSSDTSSSNTWLQANDEITLAAAKSYTDTSVSNLINSAPSTLDTLKELSDALGSDANFSTTVSNLIGVASDRANGAYDQANTATNNSTSASSYANTGVTLAQAAFNNSNTKFSSSGGTINGSVVISGGSLELPTGYQIGWGTGAPTFINGSSTAVYAAIGGARVFTANTSGVYAGFDKLALDSKAQAAFDKANTTAQDTASASLYANTGINNAASASLYANTGINNAASASLYANTSINNAASASAYANAGITLAQAAFNQANTGGGGGSSELTTTIPGITNSPYIGTARRYFLDSKSFTSFGASVSQPASQNIVININKNGTPQGNVTINVGSYYTTYKPISINCDAGDYITIDLISGTSTDLMLFLK